MTRLVPFGDIHLEHPHWKNPRMFTGLSDSDLDALAADIKSVRAQDRKDGDDASSGILDPFTVVKVKDINGTYINLAIDGQRRHLAGQRAGLPKSMMIEVVDLEDDPVDLTPEKADELTLKALRMFNREPLSSYELAEVARSMRERERPLATIAEAIHKSESWVSRMLKAIGTATPKLMHSWKKGEITDEQFKDLAAQKDAERQAKDTEQVVEARKSGNKEEARVRAKEVAETAKQRKAREKAEREAKAKEAKEAAAREKAAKATKGAAQPAIPGIDLDAERERLKKLAQSHNDKARDAKPTPTPKATLEELVRMADKRPPTHDYMKGFIAAVRMALGTVTPDELAKPWHAWIARVGGTAKSKKEPAPKKAPKVAAKAKAKAKPRGKIVTRADGTNKDKRKSKPKKR